MNKALLITYELRNISAYNNYQSFFDEIKKASKWWHYLPNTWIIITNQNAVSWQSRLLPLIFKNDSLLIIEVRNNSGGWLPGKAWDWINKNISL